MFGKKKGFSASQSKRMSRKMGSSMVGTHVTQSAAPKRGRHSGVSSSGPRNASQVDFSNSRRQRKATRGVVSQVGVASSTGESRAAHSKRMAQKGFAEGAQRKSRAKSLLVFLLSALLVVGVAAGVGIFVYHSSTDSKLSFGSSNAEDALIPATEGEPYYVLLAAQLGSAGKAHGSETDAYMLVRIDEQNNVLSFANIPSNIQVTLSDGNVHPLYETTSIGGQAELITRISNFAEVDIAHFVSTDAVGLAGMVDAMGGVVFNLAEEVDDPRAGTQVLYSGEQTLDGQKAVLFLRANNYQGGTDTVIQNRVKFTLAFAESALSSQGVGYAALVGEAGNYMHTDWNSSQLLELGENMSNIANATVYTCTVPGYDSGGEGSTFSPSNSQWKAMLERFKAGTDPNAVEEVTVDVTPADVTVEVRNGGGVTGAGARMGDMLTAGGYVVEGVGNVDDATVYPETLVIYKDPANEAAANAIVPVISGGRVINGGDFYTFETDVLVVIGKDWSPVS